MNLTKETNYDLLVFEYCKYDLLKQTNSIDPDSDDIIIRIENPKEREKLLIDFLQFLHNRNEYVIVIGYTFKLPFESNKIVLINTQSDINNNIFLHYDYNCFCIFYDLNHRKFGKIKNAFHYYYDPRTVIRIE